MKIRSFKRSLKKTFSNIRIKGPMLLRAMANVKYDGKVHFSGAWLTIKGSSTQTPLTSNQVESAKTMSRKAVPCYITMLRTKGRERWESEGLRVPSSWSVEWTSKELERFLLTGGDRMNNEEKTDVTQKKSFLSSSNDPTIISAPASTVVDD